MEEYIAKYILVKNIQAKFNDIQAVEHSKCVSKKQTSINYDKPEACFQQSFERNNSLMKIPRQFQSILPDAIHSNAKEVDSSVNPEYTTHNSSIASTQQKNASQCYQLAPDQCISDATLSTKGNSRLTTLSNNNSIKTQYVNAKKEATKNKNTSKIQFSDNMRNNAPKKQKPDRGMQLKANADSFKCDWLNVDSLNALDESNQINTGGNQRPCIRSTSHHSINTCDDELQVKCEQGNKKKQILVADDKHGNYYRKIILPLVYIGKSFVEHKLKGDSNVSNESKVIFEELAKLKLSGEGAMMHLPGIICCLCQRIIDLEEKLTP